MATTPAFRMSGVSAVTARLDGFSDRRILAAMSTAATRAARVLEGEWAGDILASIDRPTSATMRAVGVKVATAADPVAEVYIRSQAARTGEPAPLDWMRPQERGGSRIVKKFERALIAQGSMPAGHKVVPGPYVTLDGYGNPSRGQIVQVIAQLGRDFSPGYARVISAKLERRLATAKRHGRTYVAFPNGHEQGRIRAGIYERDGRQLRLVFAYVSGVSYRRRTNFSAIARADGAVILSRELERAIAQSAARLVSQTRGY